MPFEFKNNAISTLLSAITASQTSINIVTPVVGAFSNPASGNVIACTLKVLSTHAQYESFKNYREIIYYSVSANNVLTVARNQEGSVAPVAGWPAGTTIFTCIPSAFLNSLATEAWVEAYVAQNGGGGVQADWDATEGNAVILNKPDLSSLHAAESDNQDLSGLVEKITGYSLVADTEIAKIHSAGSDNQDLSGLMSLSGDQSATGTKTFAAVVMAISMPHIEKEASEVLTSAIFGYEIRDIDATAANTYTLPAITSGNNNSIVGLSKQGAANPVLAANVADNIYDLSSTAITLESFGSIIIVKAVYNAAGASYWMAVSIVGEVNPS